jgi:hypothetical protein
VAVIEMLLDSVDGNGEGPTRCETARRRRTKKKHSSTARC